MKIFILGPPGAGKTYLSDRLATTLNCPSLCLDSIYWNESFTKRRSVVSRKCRLMSIMSCDDWIIEGSYIAPWVMPAIKSADEFIIMNPIWPLRSVRLLRRFLAQKHDMKRKQSVKQLVALEIWGLRYGVELEKFLNLSEPALRPIILCSYKDQRQYIDAHACDSLIKR